jgi:hypothetical protein
MLSPESCFQCPRYSSNTFPAGRKSAELPSCLSYFERAASFYINIFMVFPFILGNL